MEQVVITTEYMTLGQLLKEVGAIDTGGMAKWYLEEFAVAVNGEAENRRGKKLRTGDVIELEDGREFQIVQKD
nr:S4 domain-containing protein YaaA [Shouchella shacheensis]